MMPYQNPARKGAHRAPMTEAATQHRWHEAHSGFMDPAKSGVGDDDNLASVGGSECDGIDAASRIFFGMLCSGQRKLRQSLHLILGP